MISSSSAWAHGVLVDPGAVHVCYCHNPFRYAWTEREATLRARHPLVRPVAAAPAQPLAPVGLDRRPARRPLRRELAPDRRARPALLRARVDRPLPAGGDRALPRRAGASGEHYMVLAELMAHKRIDVAVQAFNALGLPLLVVGDGPESRRLRAHRRPDGRLHRAGQRRARGRPARAGARARRDRDRGVRDRGRRGARRRPAGDRARRGRRARERDRGRHRHVLRAAASRTRWPRRCGRFDPLAVDPGACRAAAERFGADALPRRARADRRRGGARTSGRRGPANAAPGAAWRAFRAAAGCDAAPTQRDDSHRAS